MYQVMMQQITNDRINNARQQAKAHRQALHARATHQQHPAGVVDKAPHKQNSGLFGKLLAAW